MTFIFMIENKDNLPKKNERAWLKPFLFFYVKTTSWIVFPLFLGVLAGKYVSQSTGSQVLFFILLFAGFLISCLGIWREIKKYKKDLDHK